jgi:hypothetical protein
LWALVKEVDDGASTLSAARVVMNVDGRWLARICLEGPVTGKQGVVDY